MVIITWQSNNVCYKLTDDRLTSKFRQEAEYRKNGPKDFAFSYYARAKDVARIADRLSKALPIVDIPELVALHRQVEWEIAHLRMTASSEGLKVEL